MKSKPGVTFIAPHPSILYAMDVINIYWRHRFGVAPVITSGRDGTHMERSLHYGTDVDIRERAFDVRTRDLNAIEKTHAFEDVTRLLGDAFDVVLESDHLHHEVDFAKLLRRLKGEV